MPTAPTQEQAATRERQTGEDALEFLKKDHRTIAGLFAEYEAGKHVLEVAKKTTLVARVCKLLTAHATIEEEIFYPAVRETVPDAGELVDEAEVEHSSIKDLVTDLELTAPAIDPLYDAKVKVLSEYMKHHVTEEEEKIFPKLRKTELELRTLGEQLALRKKEVLGTLGAVEPQS